MTNRDTIPELGIFNIRGVKNKLCPVDQLAKQILVLNVCEIWLERKTTRL